MNKNEDQITTEKPLQAENNQVGGELNFDNLADVLRYLETQRWRITRPSLYRHGKEGKLLPETSGAYKQKAVDRYARTFLKLAATGKRLQETSDNLQRQKLEEELKNLRLKNERDKFNYEKDRGFHVPKDKMEIELAMRAGILIAGLKHWITSNSAIWIASTDGNYKKTGELINMMSIDLDTFLNQYASNKEYEVIIEADTPQASGTDA
ncbi:MAG: hypothetical protein FD159_906 [Syntrophaceae bacterium]|nr:MAG: hypothetical protein FD159_906 [Syntrophaceae bacterium]